MALRKTKRLWDLLLYVGIALIIAVGAVLYGIYTAERGVDPHLQLGWIGLALITLVVFGYVLRAQRPAWHHPKFLLGVSLCFAIHLLVWLPIVVSIGNRALPLLGIATMPEYLSMNLILDRILPRGNPTHRRAG